ncbi:MAG: hypothetical protein WBO73_07720 [Gammaproteobacteria bacterium]|jgi:hypothetical protein
MYFAASLLVSINFFPGCTTTPQKQVEKCAESTDWLTKSKDKSIKGRFPMPLTAGETPCRRHKNTSIVPAQTQKARANQRKDQNRVIASLSAAIFWIFALKNLPWKS